VKKTGLILIALVVAGAAAAAGYWWWMRNNEQLPETELVLYGNVDIREVRLAFNGSEHVGEMLVDEGDRVQAGQLLARLHTELLQAALDRARADVVAAEAEAHAAELSYRRVKELAGRKLASPETLDEAEAKSRVARAHVAAAEAALAEHAQALKDAELHAPVNGVVRERIVEVGDFVTPQTPVFTLALADPVWVRSYLPETYLGSLPTVTPARSTKPGSGRFLPPPSLRRRTWKRRNCAPASFTRSGCSPVIRCMNCASACRPR
jgi:HlyD family secretion protein